MNIDNPYCEVMVRQIYPTELQLNKANTSHTRALFSDLHLSILNGFVSSKLNDKRHDFDFDIVNFPFYTVLFPAPLLMVFTSLNSFALLGCPVILLISMLVIKVKRHNFYNKGIGIINFRNLFSKFCRRHFELVSKYNIPE